MKKNTIIAALFIISSMLSQQYTSWDNVKTQRFGKETIYSLHSDQKPLNGEYKISERSGAYAHLTFKNGKIDGSYISYDFQGNKISEANYKEGKVFGKSVSYHQNGKLEQESYYLNSLKEGTWLSYDRKGKVKSTERYKNDKKNGEWTRIVKNPAENTTATITENYKQGKPIGHWEERLKEGLLVWEKNFTSPTDYNEKKYYKNSIIASDIKYVDRKKEGLANFYTKEGLINYKIKYEKDVIIYKEEYYKNEILKLREHYKYGKRNGDYVKYSSLGFKLEEGTRKDTYKSGVWKCYDEKGGNLFSEITYDNDIANGKAKIYNTTVNRLQQEGDYLHGNKHGVWKHYTPAGKLEKEIEYDKGKQLTEKRYN